MEHEVINEFNQLTGSVWLERIMELIGRKQGVAAIRLMCERQIHLEHKMSASLTDIESEVTALTTALAAYQASETATITSLQAAQAALQAQLSAASQDPVALQTISDGLTALIATLPVPAPVVPVSPVIPVPVTLAPTNTNSGGTSVNDPTVAPTPSGDVVTAASGN